MLASFHKAVGEKGMNNWLEGEIRKEVCKRMQITLSSFPFLTNVKLEALEGNIKALKNSLTSQQHLIECFQDLVHLQEQQIWEEELAKMLKSSTQEECSHMQQKKHDHLLNHTQLYDLSKWRTFTGRLLHQILCLTDPSCSMYLGPMSRWFDAEGHERLGSRFFHLLESCTRPVGLSSLDCLLWILIVENLEHVVTALQNQLETIGCHELETSIPVLEKLDKELFPATSIPVLGLQPYMRRVKATAVSLAVDGLLSSLLSMKEKELKYGESRNPETDDYLEVIHEIEMEGIQCGLSSPLQTSYISKGPPPYVVHIISIITISQLSRYVVDMQLDTLTSRTKKVALDSSPLIIGIGTFLRQFGPTYTTEYVQYMGQYIRTLAEAANSSSQGAPKGSFDPKAEALKSTFWLRFFCKEMGVSKDLMDSCIPPALLSILETRAL